MKRYPRPMRRFYLHTLPGQCFDGSSDLWMVAETPSGRWKLNTIDGVTLVDGSRERVWRTIGGMIRWERWSESAKAIIEAEGVRPFFNA